MCQRKVTTSNSLINSILFIIIWCSSSKGQCDRYATFNHSPSNNLQSCKHDAGSSHDGYIFDALTNCVPEFQDFDLVMGFSQSGAFFFDGGECHWGSAVYLSPHFDDCNMNMNVNRTMVKACQSLNCNNFALLEWSPLEFQEPSTPSKNERCKSDNIFNTSVYFRMFGYYQNVCDIFGKQMIYQVQCECNNTYRLTFYEYYRNIKICLFETTLFANKAYYETINCSNQCTGNTYGVDNEIDEALINDFECRNQCINDSKFRKKQITTTTTTELIEPIETVDEQWFIIGITFICLLFIIVCLISSYVGYKCYTNNNKGAKYNAVYPDDAEPKVKQTASTPQ